MPEFSSILSGVDPQIMLDKRLEKESKKLQILYETVLASSDYGRGDGGIGEMSFGSYLQSCP